MFLNPYRFNTGVYFDPDALDIISRITVEPNDLQKAVINNTVKALKFNGIFSLLDSLYFSLLSSDEQASKLDWKRSDKEAIFVGDNVFFNSSYGFLTSLGSYIDADYNPASDAVHLTRDSNTTFAWITALPDYSGGPIWHPIWKRAGLTNELKTYSSDYRLAGQANNSNVFTASEVANLSAGELFTITRSGSNECHLIKGDTIVQSRYTTSVPWTETSEDYNMRILESDALADGQGGVGVWGMGAALSIEQLTALKIIIQNYINDLS